jgi:hypothetical protein
MKLTIHTTPIIAVHTPSTQSWFVYQDGYKEPVGFHEHDYFIKNNLDLFGLTPDEVDAWQEYYERTYNKDFKYDFYDRNMTLLESLAEQGTSRDEFYRQKTNEWRERFTAVHHKIHSQLLRVREGHNMLVVMGSSPTRLWLEAFQKAFEAYPPQMRVLVEVGSLRYETTLKQLLWADTWSQAARSQH